jgi:hypothetical protein
MPNIEWRSVGSPPSPKKRATRLVWSVQPRLDASLRTYALQLITIGERGFVRKSSALPCPEEPRPENGGSPDQKLHGYFGQLGERDKLCRGRAADALSGVM